MITSLCASTIAPSGFLSGAFAGLPGLRCLFRNLKPGGTLAVHATNHHLELAPLVALAAQSAGKHARIIRSRQEARDDPKGELTSIRVIVADRADTFEREPLKGRTEAIESHRRLNAWADDYSSLIPLLKSMGGGVVCRASFARAIRTC